MSRGEICFLLAGVAMAAGTIPLMCLASKSADAAKPHAGYPASPAECKAFCADAGLAVAEFRSGYAGFCSCTELAQLPLALGLTPAKDSNFKFTGTTGLRWHVDSNATGRPAPTGPEPEPKK